jgi:nitroimidazol reductase NimA-like FMN-containing flavoprotein (pyridoxamine 5'-phosphate oxidase superfamily)
MPGYGVPDTPEGLLPWTWAEERLAAAHTYWISTTRPDGRPHIAPIWAIYLDGRLLFSTGERSRKGRNVAANPNIAISVEQSLDCVTVEGTVERLGDPAVLRRFAELYQAKYDWDMSDFGEPVFALNPRVAFGFSENESFSETSTRWTF